MKLIKNNKKDIQSIYDMWNLIYPIITDMEKLHPHNNIYMPDSDQWSNTMDYCIYYKLLCTVLIKCGAFLNYNIDKLELPKFNIYFKNKCCLKIDKCTIGSSVYNLRTIDVYDIMDTIDNFIRAFFDNNCNDLFFICHYASNYNSLNIDDDLSEENFNKFISNISEVMTLSNDKLTDLYDIYYNQNFDNSLSISAIGSKSLYRYNYMKRNKSFYNFKLKYPKAVEIMELVNNIFKTPVLNINFCYTNLYDIKSNDKIKTIYSSFVTGYDDSEIYDYSCINPLIIIALITSDLIVKEYNI